ncbi:MAG TPA: VOC family protein [Intrasporangium sp.]|uniref:VOC family protein n=1 Tax=Intrasporangium sp. TaxID=1925024 RepID=UPI002D77E801|nr:VOC family protein [Intrasporangium sp.]HET7399082.1 VOC family protein [Intrasporangium sp.]
MDSFGDLHHVGITVRDLETSLAWYERVFGVQPEFVAHGSGPDLSTAVGVPDAELRFAFLRFGSCVVELLCYDNEREETFDRSNADVGSAHVCIHVPDLRVAYEGLLAKGVECLAPPLAIDDGPLKGCSFVYFKDPDGVTLELFQTADGGLTHV